MAWNTWGKASSWSQHPPLRSSSWSTPSTWQTPKKDSSENQWQQESTSWDYSSPTGGAHVDGLPPDFKTSKTHLDSREVFGKTMLRRIASTAWSSKYNLAGKEVSEVRLVDLLWRGWNNFHLRALSHGQYLSVVVARKISESVLASAVLTQLREHKWEVDELAAEYVRRNPSVLPKGASMSADEVKAAKVQALAKYMIDSVRDFHVVPTDSEDAQTMQSQAQRIADLEAQLSQELAKSARASDPSSMADPPAKRMRLSGKTSLPVVDPSTKSSTQLAEEAMNPSQSISNMVLRDVPLAGVTRANVSKWLKTVKAKVGPEKSQSIDQAISSAQQANTRLDEATFQLLRDKCAQAGLPVQWAGKIKEPEIIQVLVAATSMAD